MRVGGRVNDRMIWY